jgi:hypothetical protein
MFPGFFIPYIQGIATCPESPPGLTRLVNNCSHHGMIGTFLPPHYTIGTKKNMFPCVPVDTSPFDSSINDNGFDTRQL